MVGLWLLGQSRGGLSSFYFAEHRYLTHALIPQGPWLSLTTLKFPGPTDSGWCRTPRAYLPPVWFNPSSKLGPSLR